MKRKLTENLKRLDARIVEACGRAGRDPSRITTVVVTKNVSMDVVRTLVDMDVRHFGENQVQSLTQRAGMINEWLGRRARDLSAGARARPLWHMIGHLQRNKVKAVLPWVESIHSVDSLRLAEEIDAQAKKLDRVIPIFLQVNASGEATKQGVAVAAATHVAEQFVTMEHLELCGLMSMAPLTDDISTIRHTFERVRELYDEIVGLRVGGPSFKQLSLGMSHDFEEAIVAGATHVRIGSALFEGVDVGSPPVDAEHVE